MKLVATADTHLKSSGKLPDRLTTELETADYIVHAGDWQSIAVYDELCRYGDVIGVYGNVDDDKIRTYLPAKRYLTINGFSIGIVHGHGSTKTTEKRSLEAFDGEDKDIIIFGHSHIPMLRYFKKQLLLNPGSPTYKRTNPYYSFAILEIGEEVHAELVFFSHRK